MWRGAFRFFMAVSAAVFLASCASRPGPEVLALAVPAADARVVTVYVATTRERAEPNENVFTADRSPELNYAEFAISIPPGHASSQIEWPDGAPDAGRTFAVIGQRALTQGEFRAATRGGSEAFVFVHGYNTGFEQALFRLAQVSADANAGGTPVLFSWPSQAAVAGYVADRDSATYSRDYLVSVLSGLAADRSGRMTLLGHSMGGWLTMEALRQLKITGRGRVVDRFDVVLAAPDIDVDVFRTQLDAVGILSPPLVILVSKDDRALTFSRLLGYEHERIGLLDVEDPEVQAIAADRGLQIVDISEVSPTDMFNHDRFVGLASVYANLESGEGRREGIGEAGAFVFDAVGATLASPFRLVSRVLSN
jgi:esterase/lipase superfamily enzyme